MQFTIFIFQYPIKILQNFDRDTLLPSFIRVGTYFVDGLQETIYYTRNFVVIRMGNLFEPNPLRLENQTIKGFFDFTHPIISQFTSLNKVALIIITMLTPQKQDSIDSF